MWFCIDHLRISSAQAGGLVLTDYRPYAYAFLQALFRTHLLSRSPPGGSWRGAWPSPPPFPAGRPRLLCRRRRRSRSRRRHLDGPRRRRRRRESPRPRRRHGSSSTSSAGRRRVGCSDRLTGVFNISNIYHLCNNMLKHLSQPIALEFSFFKRLISFNRLPCASEPLWLTSFGRTTSLVPQILWHFTLHVLCCLFRASQIGLAYDRKLS